MYTKKHFEESTLAALSQNFTTKYGPQYYIARGHLAPNADFSQPAHRDATFFYVNAIPQWQVINNGNWKDLEHQVRRAAHSLGSDLKVITGIWGTLALPDTSGRRIKMYLDQEKKQMPLPRFIWKMVYSPEHKSGIVFVAINDPFITDVKKKDFICKGRNPYVVLCLRVSFGLLWMLSKPVIGYTTPPGEVG